MFLSAKIPIIYHYLIPDLLNIEIPDEILVNCSNCNLCQSPKSPYIDAKCCNYHPVQVNYLIGGVMADEDASLATGKSKIIKQIDEQKGVSPFGIQPDPIYRSNQERILLQENAFQSKSELDSQLCPYFDKGNCSVWKYREHLCVTYFCSSVGGKSGHQFWKKLDLLLKEMEGKLAIYASEKLGFKEDENFYKNTSTNEQVIFFQACFEIIQNLDRSTFEDLMGENFSIQLTFLQQEANIFHQKSFPEFLKFNEKLELQTSSEGNIVLSFNKINKEISPVIYTLLRLFDGKRSTQEVFLKAFAVLYNLNEIVDELLELEILVPAETAI